MPINKIKVGCVIPCYKGGKKTIDVMKTNRAGLDNIASLLLEKTSIDAKDLASLEIKY